MPAHNSAFDKETLSATLAAGIAQLPIEVTAAQHELLMTFVELLHKWNRTYNLTAVRDPALMIGNHLLDSLSIQPHLAGQTMADIGSGPGLPGIPLAIINPERSFLLVDSNSKKTRFIIQAAAQLGLNNVEVFHGKAEDYPAQPGFDTVMCRALASVPKLLEIGGHLINQGGRLVAQKGLLPDDELAHLPDPWRVEFYKVEVPMLDDKQRHVVILHQEH